LDFFRGHRFAFICAGGGNAPARLQISHLKKTREQSRLAFFMQSGRLRILAGEFDQLEETTANVL